MTTRDALHREEGAAVIWTAAWVASSTYVAFITWGWQWAFMWWSWWVLLGCFFRSHRVRLVGMLHDVGVTFRKDISHVSTKNHDSPRH